MNSFQRFQARNQKRIEANQSLNSNFIFKGYPSIQIKKDDVSVQAAVVNQHEKDKSYVYTRIKDELKIGEVWMAKTLPILITDEVVIIKDVEWHKYIGLNCNLNVEGHWGYFKGPEKSYISISLDKDAAWSSNQKPVLVLPEHVLGFEDKIVIKGRPWLVQEYDAISTPGLVYYSLTATTVSKHIADANKDKDVYIERKNEDTKIEILEEPISTFRGDIVHTAANLDLTVTTEGAYFKTSNANINIKKHSMNEVIFSIPFGIDEVIITTKEKGDEVTTTYRVV